MSKDCMAYFDRISEYLDGELEDDICRKIEEHLQSCPECGECVESLRKSIRICKEATKEEMPGNVLARLKESLQECLQNNPE